MRSWRDWSWADGNFWDSGVQPHVDSQTQLLFWEIDEAVIFIGCLGAGIAIGGWATIASLVGGWYAVKRFKRFKNGALDGILQHLCYWAGVMQLNKHYQDSSKRDFFY
ncbi:type IV conjugative transfer system protein TraL [Pseudomonas sp. FSL R10-2245]|nr:type IV conjugative transfer system protein TraL [Pseudomonas sp. FSL R10-2245]